MKKLILCGMLMCAGLQAEVTEKVMNVQVNFGSGQTDDKVEQGAPLVAGKTLAAIGVGAATGGALYFGTVFSKNYDAFSNPLTYILLSSVLLYSQRDVVKTYLGSAYTSVASLTSMVSLVATGAVSELYLRVKRITGYAPKVQPEDAKNMENTRAVSA